MIKKIIITILLMLPQVLQAQVAGGGGLCIPLSPVSTT